MADFRKWLYALAFVALIAGLTVPATAQIQPFTCAALQAGVTPTIRAEGYTELVGDLVLNCTGGASTTAGQAVPQIDITVISNTNITSRVTASGSGGSFEDALLIIDEPNAPGPNSNRPILNCGNTGAPDTNLSAGPGVCSISSNGNPAQTYDGTLNVVGQTGGTATVPLQAVCGSGGGAPLVPASGSYGCGRPNVFQGRQGTVFNPGQFNAVTFNGVPIDPPGTGTNRVLRFTNIRVDAEFYGVASGFNPNTITLSVSTNGSTSIGINISQQVVAFIAHGLNILSSSGNTSINRLNFVQCESELPLLYIGKSSATVNAVWASCATAGGSSQCGTGGIASISFQEGFANSWKTKNLSYLVANGTPSTPGGGYIYSGTAAVPTVDDDQNVPGAVYNTESGFEYNSAATLLNPNPPSGISSTVVTGANNTGYAFNSGATGISGAGVANNGTRLAVAFSNIPSGASVWVSPLLYLYRQGTTSSSIPGVGGTITGVMLLTSTDAQGDTAFTQAGTPNLGTGGNLVQVSNSLAVYEIIFADNNTSEQVDVPVRGGLPDQPGRQPAERAAESESSHAGDWWIRSVLSGQLRAESAAAAEHGSSNCSIRSGPDGSEPVRNQSLRVQHAVPVCHQPGRIRHRLRNRQYIA